MYSDWFKNRIDREDNETNVKIDIDDVLITIVSQNE